MIEVVNLTPQETNDLHLVVRSYIQQGVPARLETWQSLEERGLIAREKIAGREGWVPTREAVDLVEQLP